MGCVEDSWRQDQIIERHNVEGSEELAVGVYGWFRSNSTCFGSRFAADLQVRYIGLIHPVYDMVMFMQLQYFY